MRVEFGITRVHRVISFLGGFGRFQGGDVRGLEGRKGVLDVGEVPFGAEIDLVARVADGFDHVILASAGVVEHAKGEITLGRVFKPGEEIRGRDGANVVVNAHVGRDVVDLVDLDGHAVIHRGGLDADEVRVIGPGVAVREPGDGVVVGPKGRGGDDVVGGRVVADDDVHDELLARFAVIAARGAAKDQLEAGVPKDLGELKARRVVGAVEEAAAAAPVGKVVNEDGTLADADRADVHVPNGSEIGVRGDHTLFGGSVVNRGRADTSRALR